MAITSTNAAMAVLLALVFAISPATPLPDGPQAPDCEDVANEEVCAAVKNIITSIKASDDIEARAWGDAACNVDNPNEGGAQGGPTLVEAYVLATASVFTQYEAVGGYRTSALAYEYGRHDPRVLCVASDNGYLAPGWHGFVFDDHVRYWNYTTDPGQSADLWAEADAFIVATPLSNPQAAGEAEQNFSDSWQCHHRDGLQET